MPIQQTLTTGATGLQDRPTYGAFKRAKRGVLRAFGRWSRADYDVQFVFDGEQIRYKKITFNHTGPAARVIRNLQGFGPSDHLPTWHLIDGRSLWIDYIDGQPLDRIETPPITEITRCFAEFAGRHSRRVAVEQTGCWDRLWANVEHLATCELIDNTTGRAIVARSAACRPAALRVGFDYLDPIAPNLVQRADNGRICAIDLKNWHAETLVGQGLAKATDRWLDAKGCAHVLETMAHDGLADVAESFDFIRRYERLERLRRRVDTELAIHGRIRKPKSKRARSAELAD